MLAVLQPLHETAAISNDSVFSCFHFIVWFRVVDQADLCQLLSARSNSFSYRIFCVLLTALCRKHQARSFSELLHFSSYTRKKPIAKDRDALQWTLVSPYNLGLSSAWTMRRVISKLKLLTAVALERPIVHYMPYFVVYSSR